MAWAPTPLVSSPNGLPGSSCTQRRFSAPRGYYHGTNRRPPVGNVRQQMFSAEGHGWLHDFPHQWVSVCTVYTRGIFREHWRTAGSWPVASPEERIELWGALSLGAVASIKVRSLLLRMSQPSAGSALQLFGATLVVGMPLVSNNTEPETRQCNRDVPPPIGAWHRWQFPMVPPSQDQGRNVAPPRPEPLEGVLFLDFTFYLSTHFGKRVGPS
jgi:hypothetical protein